MYCNSIALYQRCIVFLSNCIETDAGLCLEMFSRAQETVERQWTLIDNGGREAMDGRTNQRISVDSKLNHLPCNVRCFLPSCCCCCGCFCRRENLFSPGCCSKCIVSDEVLIASRSSARLGVRYGRPEIMSGRPPAGRSTF